MEPLKLLKSAWVYRKNWVQKNNLTTFRLVNGKADTLPHLTIDVYGGSFLAVLKDPSWIPKMGQLREMLQILSPEMNLPGSFQFYEIQNFSNSSSSPSPVLSKVEGREKERGEGEVKIVGEGDLLFEIHLGEGLHTGLFLDQRDNRKRLRSLSKEKRVLNLFSYTGAFTVAALKGEAKEVVSVDLSKNYLAWLTRNVEINHLNLKEAPVFAVDVFRFLKGAERRGEVYDLIILDPPTFSRGEKGTFSTERDLEKLVGQVAKRLSPGGKLFVSVNTQGLTPSQFQTQVSSVVSPLGLQVLESFPPSFDFRLSPEEAKNPHLKSCLVG